MCSEILSILLKLVPKMNDEHVLKGALQAIEFGTGKEGEFSTALNSRPNCGVRVLKQASHTWSGANL